MTPDNCRADSTLEENYKRYYWDGKTFHGKNPTKQLIHCIFHAENVPTCLGRHKLEFLKGELKSEGKMHGGVIINASKSKWGDARFFDRIVNYQGVFRSRFIQSLVLYTLQQH